MKGLVLFPDTNLFVQCRALAELPWRHLGDYDEVRLILSRPTLDEIDAHKKGGNGRLASRARSVNSMIRPLALGQQQAITIRSDRPTVRLTRPTYQSPKR